MVSPALDPGTVALRLAVSSSKMIHPGTDDLLVQSEMVLGSTVSLPTPPLPSVDFKFLSLQFRCPPSARLWPSTLSTVDPKPWATLSWWLQILVVTGRDNVARLA